MITARGFEEFLTHTVPWNPEARVYDASLLRQTCEEVLGRRIEDTETIQDTINQTRLALKEIARNTRKH